ncbi:hypothetical protein [Turkeypox virus]|uniref:Uncharacterized protein n=1 Tax=Turkeypox virus TaxID=336486 RepID=A0A0M5HR85_9POXV|nr:hypothetical protein ASN15_gp109 [Turkeypox virus]ALA62483.1 hypothetical protein [Turkeypox virus]
MITILVIYIIVIVFFLFMISNKATPVLKQNDDSLILHNITKRKMAAENELADIDTKLTRAKEQYYADRDLTSSTKFNKNMSKRTIDPYMAIKFTYDVLERWYLL